MLVQVGEDGKAAVRRSGGQRYQSNRSPLSSNQVKTLFLPRDDAGEYRANGGGSAASPLLVDLGLRGLAMLSPMSAARAGRPCEPHREGSVYPFPPGFEKGLSGERNRKAWGGRR